MCVHGRPHLKGVPHSAGTGTQALMNWNLGSMGTAPKQVMSCSWCVYITICCCTVMKLLLLTYYCIINITSLYQFDLPQTPLNHAASPCLQVREHVFIKMGMKVCLQEMRPWCFQIDKWAFLLRKKLSLSPKIREVVTSKPSGNTALAWVWEKAKVDQLLQNACEIFLVVLYQKDCRRFPLPAHSYLLLRKTHTFCLGYISSAEYKLQEIIFSASEKCYIYSVIVDTSTVRLGIVFVSNCVRNMRNAVSGGIALKMQKYYKHVCSLGQPALGGCAWAMSRWPPQVLSNCSLSDSVTE